MADIIKNATEYRNKLQAEIAKVDEFLRMAQKFAQEADELRLTDPKPAEASARPNGEADEAPKPRPSFAPMRPPSSATA